jgi:hypothetical protein
MYRLLGLLSTGCLVVVACSGGGGGSKDTPGGCQPSCDGKACGSDGCGGSCGECGEGLVCGEESACIPDPECQASCEGRECGSDGCGGSCGECGAAPKEVCDGKDNDCDGQTDEWGEIGEAPLCPKQNGYCKGARSVCQGGWKCPLESYLSCKSRICPSCLSRRASDTTANPVTLRPPSPAR